MSRSQTTSLVAFVRQAQPLLALEQRGVLRSQRSSRDVPSFAQNVTRSESSSYGPVDVLVRDDGHAAERVKIRVGVEAGLDRPRAERLDVDGVVVVEELPHERRGDVLAVHDQREGDVPEAVGALVSGRSAVRSPSPAASVVMRVSLPGNLPGSSGFCDGTACRCLPIRSRKRWVPSISARQR